MFRRSLLALLLLVPAFAFAQTTAPAPTPAKPATAKPAKPPAAKGAAKPAATKPTGKTASDTATPPAPKVLLKTSLGDITLELYPDKAPKSVDNFLGYVNGGFYDGTIFHRVIGSFMIQGGGFTKDLRQKPTKAPIVIESKNGLSNARGTLAMARTSDPNSATAQFFINTVDNPRLDYVSDTNPGYCVFGKVITGMDTVDKISKSETGPQGPFRSDVPVTPVVIETASAIQ
ncbi:MAG: peptidyl-prolyl cis-trans isomerase [Rhodanobacter sp.]|jgi:peptidyl-prolyl cis-trans isomerase A (cyclophilin A)/peptidyl-prolyl cis-trans isomerase B (cyclophilin B)|nr:peptidyl-prolyl cis-trans isomerase [Rhodanobacter sp.]